MEVICVNWRIIDTDQEADFGFRCASEEVLIGVKTSAAPLWGSLWL